MFDLVFVRFFWLPYLLSNDGDDDSRVGDAVHEPPVPSLAIVQTFFIPKDLHSVWMVQASHRSAQQALVHALLEVS